MPEMKKPAANRRTAFWLLALALAFCVAFMIKTALFGFGAQ